MKTYKNILKVLLALSVIGVVVLLSLYTGYLRFNYPTFEEYPIQGIDVSHHQKEIKWGQIDKQEAQFVFIKATEGGDFKDKAFKRNWDEAKKYNLVVGAYHFFTFCKSGEEQSKNFIETVPLENGVLPPVIDLEFGGNCSTTKNKEDIIKEINVLENNLYRYYKKKPILYVTEPFYNKFLIGRFEDNPLWFRDVYKTPQIKNGRNWTFWQYGNRGHLNGIEAYVDLNVFNGTAKDFEQLIK